MKARLMGRVCDGQQAAGNTALLSPAMGMTVF